MIKFDHVTKRFGRLHVLHDVSIELPEGECIALIGHNGCGKTTLIKSLLGMVLPDAGQIMFQNQDVKQGFQYRQNIGYMPQIGHYPENMTIGQVMDMVKNLRNGQSKTDMELAEAYQLDKLKDKPMGTLSGGTTQKVSAALAFLFDPKVLILDEPTAGLDPLASEILKEKILKERSKGKLILITSHLLSELDDMVSRILFMKEGRIAFFLSVEELKAKAGENSISKCIIHYLKMGHE